MVANAAATATVLVASRWAGSSWAELGLARRSLPAGLRCGGACAVVVTAGYAVALAVPAFRPLLADARVPGRDGADLAYQALVRIPVDTVLWEEVAFRGVLLAVLLRLVSLPTATTSATRRRGAGLRRSTREYLFGCATAGSPTWGPRGQRFAAAPARLR